MNISYRKIERERVNTQKMYWLLIWHPTKHSKRSKKMVLRLVRNYSLSDKHRSCTLLLQHKHYPGETV